MEVHEEDANISTFRRGNKIIAVGFMVIISTTLLILILTSAVLLPPILNDSLSNSSLQPISVEKFCSYSHTEMCITTLNSIVADRFAIEPNQIVALCIQTAAIDLQNLITTSLTRTRDGNCSDSLLNGSGRVLAATKRPFLGWLSKERDDVVIWKLMAAKDDVDSCIRDSAAGESPETAAETAAKLDGVNVYLNSAYGFVLRYGARGIIVVEKKHFFENLFGLCLCGVQLFVFGLLCLFLRKRWSGVSLSRLYVYCRNSV